MLYLASQSPRRYQLLKQLAIAFQRFSVNVDESVEKGESVLGYIHRIVNLKKNKAQQCVNHDDIVLVADTIVTLDGNIFTKPNSYQDAKYMLEQLSANQHEVYTSICVAQGDNSEMLDSVSQVKFRRINEHEIKAYWDSQEPCDKAGAYAIQGLGSIFVESICGSYSSIMGLPLYETAMLLEKFGISILEKLE
ncbi:Maf family nucleotide pyrophosphatase [Thiotrichales bacterium 19S3-7]|nr:Maf family nucleotide pyrophosphatase [Thiotrichales bacterium 19S3-7]MCF6801733.1 Maf family nucleotide pyrophosphatase [Thiotrichales bacterium 19S3-11]